VEVHISGSVSLDLVDVHGKHIPESVDLFFHSSSPGPIPCARNYNGSKTIRVTDLPAGTYKLASRVIAMSPFSPTLPTTTHPAKN
jgi:hypothetical protein